MARKIYNYEPPAIPCAPGTVNIIDSNSNPIGSQTVASGGTETYVVDDLPCSAPTPSGIAYQEPNLSSIINTSYADYDAGWRSQNNAYINVQPDYPEYYQTLDPNSSDPHNTLLYNNIFGNKYRFTDSIGSPISFLLEIDLYDHLTGRIYWRSNWPTYDFENSLIIESADGMYIPSYNELLSLSFGNTGNYNINNLSIGSLGSENNWTCNTDIDDSLKGIYLSGGTSIATRVKVGSARPKFVVRLMHPISNP